MEDSVDQYASLAAHKKRNINLARIGAFRSFFLLGSCFLRIRCNIISSFHLYDSIHNRHNYIVLIAYDC